MNTFIAIYKIKPIEINPSIFVDYLIDKPTETHLWESKDKLVSILSFKVRPKSTIQEIIHDTESVFTYEGFPLLSNKTYNHKTYLLDLHNASKTLGLSFFQQLTGEYSAVAYSDGNLTIGSNLGGSHGLYYTQNEHLVAFTNRSPLLLQLPHVSKTIDVQTSAWKCYQGYISTNRTPYEEIRKAPIGTIFNIRKGLIVEERETTYQDLKSNEIREHFESDPLQAYTEQFDFIAAYLHQFIQHHDGLKLHVPLSGGKDSRLILALLIKAGLRDDIEKVWTHGPLYSPEVISSQEICRRLALPEPEIRRPATMSNSKPSAHLIIHTLNNLEANHSLYDFSGIPNYNFITMQGHQIALRDGAFTNCSIASLDRYLDDAVKARMHDPMSLLNDEFSHSIKEQFRGIFSTYHTEEGAPLHDLGDLYYLRDRLLNWASPYCNSQYYSGPLSNPLLLGDLFKFSFSIPYELRRYEVFHYLGIKHCAPEALNVPFANQKWNNELPILLNKYNIADDLKPATPFKSHKNFPNVANPYVASIKVDYMNALKVVMTDLANKHRSDLNEYMQVDKFKAHLKLIGVPTFRELYCTMGVYSDLIVREYSDDIFSAKARPDVILELEQRISRRVSVVVSETSAKKDDKPEESEKQKYEDIIERHEKSIASLVEEAQTYVDDLERLKSQVTDCQLITGGMETLKSKTSYIQALTKDIEHLKAQLIDEQESEENIESLRAKLVSQKQAYDKNLRDMQVQIAAFTKANNSTLEEVVLPTVQSKLKLKERLKAIFNL